MEEEIAMRHEEQIVIFLFTQEIDRRGNDGRKASQVSRKCRAIKFEAH